MAPKNQPITPASVQVNLLWSEVKKRSSPRGTCGSAIDHQLDRIDVRRVVGGKEKHRFGKFFRLPPAAQWNGRRDETSNLDGLFISDAGAGPAFPDGSLRGAGCDDIHANVPRGEVGGNGTRHGDKAALRGCICGKAGLAEIVVHRSVKDDTAVVIQQRSS